MTAVEPTGTMHNHSEIPKRCDLAYYRLRYPLFPPPRHPSRHARRRLPRCPVVSIKPRECHANVTTRIVPHHPLYTIGESQLRIGQRLDLWTTISVPEHFSGPGTKGAVGCACVNLVDALIPSSCVIKSLDEEFCLSIFSFPKIVAASRQTKALASVPNSTVRDFTRALCRRLLVALGGV